MRQTKLKHVRTVVVSAAAVVVISGCGTATSTRPTVDAESALQANRVDLVLGDCSTYRSVTEAFVPTMVKIAESSAQARRVLWSGCFDGAPLRTLSWKVQVDFDELPPSVANNAQVTRSFNQARALGLQGRLAAMVKRTPTRAPGSGQLEALEVAAQTAHVGRVFMITDAQIDEVDGVNLLTATPEQIQQCVEVWAPRLRALKGAQLWFIGVGFLAPTSASVRRSEVLFQDLATAVEASFSWSQSLPANFPAPTAN